MKHVFMTYRHYEARLRTRPAEYAQEIEPAIVSRGTCGGANCGMVIDVEHPAWLAAVAKYRAERSSGGGGCGGCGGDVVAIAAMRGDPQAAERLLREL
jgi:hypothetical protein